MDLLHVARALCAHEDPAGGLVTLTLDLSRSGRLPEATRVFLKDQVYKNLASEARPENLRAALRKVSQWIRGFVEMDARPESDGLFLAAGPRLFRTVEFRHPLRNFLFVGRNVYVAPLLEAARRRPRALLVELGQRDGWIEELGPRGPGRRIPLETPELADDLERATAPRGGAERDLRQRKLREAGRSMAREAAAWAVALHREAPIEWIVTRGDVEAFLAKLPKELRARCLESEGEDPWARIGLRAAETLREELRRFEEGREQGLCGALGPRDVLEALAAGSLERVYLDPDDPQLGVACVSCGARFPELRRRCGYCEGDVVLVSTTQDVVSHALRHPRPALTFLSPAPEWLRRLGGMAGLLRTSGRLVRR